MCDGYIAESVVFQVAGKRLLDGVDCCLRPGELLAVLGPNGAGKSTLLRLLAGELRPSAGAVRLNGRALAAWQPLALARQRAVLPQQSALGFPFLVEEVVAMGRSPHRDSSRARQQAIVREAMHCADVLPLATRTWTSLSGGERQRVQLARVLAQVWEPSPAGPRYLLLDEPTSALDIAHQHQLLGIARRLIGDGDLGVLAILHDLNLAMRYADRLLLLKDGRTMAEGDPGLVADQGHLAQTFSIPVQVIAHPGLAGRRLVLAGTAEHERVAV